MSLLFNPIYAPGAPKRRVDPSEATETARRLVRKAATVKFGRGRTTLVYTKGRWWAVVRPAGQALEWYAAVAGSPGIAMTGVNFEAAR